MLVRPVYFGPEHGCLSQAFEQETSAKADRIGFAGGFEGYEYHDDNGGRVVQEGIDRDHVGARDGRGKVVRECV